MNELDLNVSRADQNAASVNKVVRNTYTLLSMTLFFSALCAVATMALGFGQGAGLLMIIGGFVMSFVVRATAESSKGILAVFVFAGLMGGGLGPTLSAYLMMYSNGAAIIAQALGGTGLIFLGGERNYIMATISLYLSIFNLFIHLLNLIGALTGRD